MRSSFERLDAACLILAGGRGRRLTPDKPLLVVDGRPMIERVAGVVTRLFEDVRIVTNAPEKYAFLGLPCIVDERPDRGPLMGLYSGLKRVEHEVAFACAADMPFLDERIIRACYREIGDFDLVVPCPTGLPEFLHAFYRKRCLPAMRDCIETDRLKVELLAERCRTRRLEKDWFSRQGWGGAVDRAFTNINTPDDYERFAGGGTAPGSLVMDGPGLGALDAVASEVLREIRRALIEQETAFEETSHAGPSCSLWAHSRRVATIAGRIARAEGLDPEPALLAGLLHDAGKFVHGTYHEGETAEEETAVRFGEMVLSGTVHEKWIPEISDAILSLYREDEAPGGLAGVLYDADRLDKMGCLGVAQFFTKSALRRRFLDRDLMIRTGVELTYARHAADTLETATGRSLAGDLAARTRRYYEGLLEEWQALGLGEFRIQEEDIEGITCVLVVPTACECGGEVDLESDIRESVKCRAAVVDLSCRDCGWTSGFSFCLPNVKGLPRRREP